MVDANADGWNDILVGAPYGEAPTRIGTLYVFFGGSEMDSIPDLVFHSPSAMEGDYFAGELSGLPDFNADGYPDFLAGGFYVLKCGNCRHEYGANGSDIHERLCPKCQGGMPGIPLKA